ncbi:MAG: hypothetical protein ACM31D_18955 [Bacteroidota bacterium]
MFHFDYPILLAVSADERDKALVWLMKNHPKLECQVEDMACGGAEIRVRNQDADILDALAELLDRP